MIDTIRANKTQILSLAAKNGLKDLRIFGSVARGDDDATSDVDMLVNVADASDPFAFLDFQEEVSSLLNRRVDLVFERGLYHRMREAILKEARPL